MDRICWLWAYCICETYTRPTVGSIHAAVNKHLTPPPAISWMYSDWFIIYKRSSIALLLVPILFLSEAFTVYNLSIELFWSVYRFSHYGLQVTTAFRLNELPSYLISRPSAFPLRPPPWPLFLRRARTITRELSLAYALVKCFMAEWFITPYITPLTPQIHTSLP